MDGNIVKAAWVLGGSIFASVVVGGVGLLGGAIYLSHGFYENMDKFTKRSADAVLEAPKNTRVGFKAGEGDLIKVGFEPKLPIAMRVENSMDENNGKRAAFEVDVKPTLAK